MIYGPDTGHKKDLLWDLCLLTTFLLSVCSFWQSVYIKIVETALQEIVIV